MLTVDVYLTEIRLTTPGAAVLEDIVVTSRAVRELATTPDRVLWAVRDGALIVQTHGAPRIERFGAYMSDVRTGLRGGVHEGRVRVGLIAHPTVSERSSDGRRGVRRTLPESEWERWLRQRLASAVELESVRVRDLGPRSGRQRHRTVVHRWVRFDAVGEVIDSADLTRLQDEGVGVGRAYGCGLLLTAPCRPATR